MTEVRILATCALGLGFSYRGFQAGLDQEPHLVACDAGSSDYGPFYLGSGTLQKAPAAVSRELTTLMEGARRVGAPFATGSVGGAGGDPHVDAVAEQVRSIAAENGWAVRLATIKANVPQDFLRRTLSEGRLHPLGSMPKVTDAVLDRLSAAVAQMGVTPFRRALDLGADVIVGGRATDPAIFVGAPLRAGIPAGPAWHAAKSIDKGYLATTRPQDGSPVLARIRNDHFTIEPTREGSRCTVETVAGMVVYENDNPYEIPQPEGVIDTHQAQYDQMDERTVKVTGSRFRPADHLTIKIEGAELIGYRAILLAGIRDPRLITGLDAFLEAYRHTLSRVAHNLGLSEAEYQLRFRVYGRDAVMGAYEALAGPPGHEVGLVVDLVGRTPEVLAKLAPRLGPTGSRLGLQEGVVGGGNFAFPFSPAVASMGPVYAWSVWHLAELSEAEMAEIFPVTIETIGPHG